jgi:uncharacterized Zn finger protein
MPLATLNCPNCGRTTHRVYWSHDAHRWSLLQKCQACGRTAVADGSIDRSKIAKPAAAPRLPLSDADHLERAAERR